MAEQATAPQFAVVSGAQVAKALTGDEKRVIELVEAAYRQHGAGDTVNPPSYFLRFPDRPESRIIALPASLGGEVDGIKWVSSFPANIEQGLPRASALLILNDPATGYPYACLEGSIISAARTAASAALAADWLSRPRPGGRPRRVGFIGTGLIARYVHTYLVANGFQFDEVGVFDASAEHAAGFGEYLAREGHGSAVLHRDADSLIGASDLVVFATTAASPHVHDPGLFEHNPLVLHVSLRDLAAEVILAATNIVDDVEHCLKANTSPHLAEQLSGGRDFIDGALPQVLAGDVVVSYEKPVIFSPFGLGVLDLAVGRHVHRTVAGSGDLAVVDGFFHDLRRYG
jgi:ornithine cyclodeaminase